MHILHIINDCDSGGAGHVIMELIAEHRRQGITVTVAYLQGPERLKRSFIKLGAKTVLLGKNPFSALKILYNLVLHGEKPVSAIHTHLVHASLLGRLIAKISNTPVITTRHYMQRSKKYHIAYILEDITARWSDAYIAISTAVRKYLVQSKISSNESCQTIYNPVNLKSFSSIRIFDISESSNIVCNARFIRLKGIEYLLEAFKEIAEKIPESRLVLIGRYSSESKIIKGLSNHPFNDRIILRGFISQREIISELSKARVYVQPSLMEGLGLTAIEAMLMECPCIFSRVGGLIELAQKNDNAILVESGNSVLLAQEILSLWNNMDESIRIGKNAKSFAIDHFDSAKIAAQYLAVYKSILAKKY